MLNLDSYIFSLILNKESVEIDGIFNKGFLEKLENVSWKMHFK